MSWTLRPGPEGAVPESELVRGDLRSQSLYGLVRDWSAWVGHQFVLDVFDVGEPRWDPKPSGPNHAWKRRPRLGSA